MRIGMVWPSTDRLTEITVRFERYVTGFEQLGHQVVTICCEQAARGYRFPVHSIAGPEVLRDRGLWRTLSLDAAVIITWLGMPETVEAIALACPHVVSISDSDGVVGHRVQPVRLLRRMVAAQTRWGMKARAAKYWVELILGGYRAAERPLIASAEASDRVSLTSPGARANLARVFTHHRRPELASKLIVVPYPVDDEFLAGDAASASDRPDRVVAIGRWDDPQKDGRLLAAGIESAARDRPGTEFVLIGRGGETLFARLSQRFPRVRYAGNQSPSEIAQILRASRVLVLSSAWESGPIVASEALCAGCSVVGPSWVPTIPWYCGEGPYGRAFARRSARALAGALRAELADWDLGHRDPGMTARHFRPWFTPRNVCELLLSGATPRRDDPELVARGRPAAPATRMVPS